MIWMYYDCFSFNVCSSAAAIALGFDKVVEFGSRVFTIFGGDYSFWLFYSLLSFTILKRRARICMWRSVFFTIYFLLHKNNRATYIVVVGVGHPWVSEFPPPPLPTKPSRSGGTWLFCIIFVFFSPSFERTNGVTLCILLRLRETRCMVGTCWHYDVEVLAHIKSVFFLFSYILHPKLWCVFPVVNMFFFFQWPLPLAPTGQKPARLRVPQQQGCDPTVSQRSVRVLF